MGLENNNKDLCLRGEHKVENDNIVRKSRINRVFSLGTNADERKISARMSKGMLHVTVPKLEIENVEKNRTIEITEDDIVKTGEGQEKESTSNTTVEEKSSEDKGEEEVEVESNDINTV